MKWLKFWFIGLLAILSSCSYPDQEITVFSISFPFSDSDQGWTGDFADYPENDSVTYELFFGHDLLPDTLRIKADNSTKGLHIAGNNYNDDLFMFVKKKISGLRANATYEILFNVRVASNTNTTDGATVYLKAGASLIEPRKELQAGTFRLNIDKGNQAVDGVDMINIGNIGVSSNTTQYTIVTRTNNSHNSFTITTDDSGEIWLVIGTDSGFAGITELYYTQVDVSFNQLN